MKRIALVVFIGLLFIVTGITVVFLSESPPGKIVTITHKPPTPKPVLVPPKPIVIKNGTLVGSMTIGPICPVERVDNPCLPTAEMFAAHPVSVYKKDHTTKIATLTPDAQGIFTTRLPEGDYWIDVTHQAVGGTTGAPQEIHITENATTSVTIDIDTGIR